MVEIDEKGAVILSIILTLATAIIVARQLFPIFLVLSILTSIILLVVIVFFREFSLYVVVAFLILLFLTFVSWFIGYGIGGTSFGQASLDVYYAIIGAEQQVDQTFQDSINQIVNESCKTLDERSCNILKTYAQSAKTIEEVRNKVNELKKLNNLIRSK